MEGVGSIDTTAVDQLVALLDELRAGGMVVALARPNQRVVDMLRRSGVIGDDTSIDVFPTINAAVAAHRRRTGG